MARVRIGNVSYLNATPLVAGLDADPNLELVSAVPSAVAAGVASGELDLGLVPIAEAARLGLFVAGGGAIASQGPVRSVLLLHRVPLTSVRSLALDPASRTSVALSRIVLRAASAVDPELVAGPASGDPLPAGVDAAVVIGDRALLYRPGLRVSILDLGSWWRDTQGLPFVYAVWAGRDAGLVKRMVPRLVAALRRGLAERPAIAAREAARRGLAPELAADYLENVISYGFGEREQRGGERFVELMKEHRLLPAAAGFHLLGA